MRLSIIFTVLSAGLYVNASAFTKRTVTGPTLTCISDLDTVIAQGTTAENTIGSFTANQGYVGVIAIQAQLQTLSTRLSTSGTDCCAIPSPFSSDDGDAILAEYQNFYSAIAGVLNILVQQHPQLTAIVISNVLIHNAVNDLCTKYNTIASCLVSGAPISVQSSIVNYNAIVVTACASAMAAYP